MCMRMYVCMRMCVRMYVCACVCVCISIQDINLCVYMSIHDIKVCMSIQEIALGLPQSKAASNCGPPRLLAALESAAIQGSEQ